MPCLLRPITFGLLSVWVLLTSIFFVLITSLKVTFEDRFSKLVVSGQSYWRRAEVGAVGDGALAWRPLLPGPEVS